MSMKRKARLTAVAATAALLLVLLCVWLLSENQPKPSNLLEAIAEPEPNAALISSNREPNVTADRNVPAVSESETLPLTSEEVEVLAHVRGRCLAAEDGTPIAGCIVKLDGFGGNANRVAMQGKVEWKDPDPVLSDDAGHFDVAFVPPSGYQFGLDIQGADRVPRTGRWSAIGPDEVIDLGDIQLSRGFEVRGRVVDEAGVPLHKAGVSLANLPLPLAPNMAANDQRSGWADESGEFVIKVPIPEGTWPVILSVRGCRLVSPELFTIDSSGRYDPLLVVVRRMPSIQGIVSDESGVAVEGVSVEAVAARSGRIASGRSNKEGQFTLFAVDADPQPVLLKIDNPGPCEPTWSDERLWEWGTKDVQVVLKRALTFELRVVELGRDLPVLNYAVSCYSHKANSSLQSDLRLSGEHTDGKVVVDRVWRGKCFLAVYPLDPALRPSEVIEFDASEEGIPPMQIEVERMRSGTVLVRTSADAPVEGATVEVILKGTTNLGPEELVMNSRSGQMWHTADSKYRHHELCYAGTTNTDGRAQVMYPGVNEIAIRVTSAAHPRVLVNPASFEAEKEFIVTLPEAGSIRGEVQLASLDPLQTSIHLLPAGAPPENRQSLRTAKPSKKGEFELRGLIAGNYALELRYSIRHRTSHGSSGYDMRLDLPATEAVVITGKTTEAWIDASSLIPGTLRGRVRIGGKAATSCQVDLRHEGGATFGRFLIAEDGTFYATDLLPGTYRMLLITGDLQATRGDAVPDRDKFTLGPGQHLEREFSFTPRRLIVRCLEPDGSPAANLRVRGHGDQWWCDKTTDSEGRAKFELVPEGKLNIQPQRLGSKAQAVEFPEGQSEYEVSFTLTEFEKSQNK